MENTNAGLPNATDYADPEICRRLVMLRSDILHLSQSQCAAALGISQTYLSLIESGKRAITIELLQQYSDCYNVRLDWVLYGDDSNGIVGDKPL